MFRIALSYIIEHNAAAKINTVSGMPFIVLVLLLVCVSLCSASVCVCVCVEASVSADDCARPQQH